MRRLTVFLKTVRSLSSWQCRSADLHPVKNPRLTGDKRVGEGDTVTVGAEMGDARRMRGKPVAVIVTCNSCPGADKVDTALDFINDVEDSRTDRKTDGRLRFGTIGMEHG